VPGSAEPDHAAADDHDTGDIPVGIRIDQHLRRTRIELPRTIEGDRSSVVTAPRRPGSALRC
jgi:hypothetical protein